MECYKEKKFIVFEDSERGSAKFDLSTSECWRFYNGKWRPVKSLNSYFKNIDSDDIVGGLSKTEPAYGKFLNSIKGKYYSCSNVGTFLNRLHELSHLENYHLLDIKVTNDIAKPTSFYPKDILRIFSKHKKFTVTSMLENLVEKHGDIILNILRYADSKWGDDEDDFIFVTSMLDGWSSRCVQRYIRLVTEFNYEYKSLINYALWHIPRYENMSYVDAMVYLSDYAYMKTEMGVKFDKYPKFLRSVHDITLLGYEKLKIIYDELSYKETIDDSLEYEDGKYMIVYPKDTTEIKLEGSNLSHCVASYIKDVIDGKTRILFLRKKENPDESLVTIEIKGSDIIQARGYLNRDPIDAEKEFLLKYVKKMGLNYTELNVRL